jgi:opacity protein-like surface antigen
VKWAGGLYSRLSEGKIMKPKSITHILALLLVAAVFLMMPGPGRAGLWIGVQGGPNFVANADVKGTYNRRLQNVKTEPALLGGVLIGYDFVKEGFLGYDWPNWLKYFSLAIDITYNDFSQKAQNVQYRTSKTQIPIHISQVQGHMLVLSFLFIAKYGFFPAPEFPFGRLIPYVGVGPGVFFSVAETSHSFSGYPSSDSAETGIVTEAGVRYMVLRNVSLDAAFRYRYVIPSYDVDYFTNRGQFHVPAWFESAHQFNAIFRVSYHF